MAERLAYDIARDLRARGPWPSEKLLCEAADKLEGLIELLATAERERDQARAITDAAKALVAAWEADGLNLRLSAPWVREEAGTLVDAVQRAARRAADHG